ncbi:MAG TPA: glycosyltransferase, partial [Thermodesulfobacteriota bacterium]|nr:glycosyltransferase [Thermodesulfobacteriota bacterium]
MDLTGLLYFTAAAWGLMALHPWGPARIRERLEASASDRGEFPDVTVLIPARNEARLLPSVLSGVQGQGRGFEIILVDDQSADATAEVAQSSGLENLRVIEGEAPPPGWSGKLWALSQGLKEVRTPLTLLIDADIELEPG